MMKGPLYRHQGHTFHPGLVCDVESITYAYDTRVGVIHVREGDCTDMAGAIALFTRLDPRVQAIQTYAGGRLDTVYRREGTGWRAEAHDGAEPLRREAPSPSAPDESEGGP